VGFKDPGEIEEKWKSVTDFSILIQNANSFVKENLSEDAHVKRFVEVLTGFY
jgi:hypothetical protein